MLLLNAALALAAAALSVVLYLLVSVCVLWIRNRRVRCPCSLSRAPSSCAPLPHAARSHAACGAMLGIQRSATG